MERQKLYSRTLKAGKRVYYFDVKKGKDGSTYLVITEQKDDKRNTLMVFEDRADEFITLLKEAVDRMKEK
ncbi:MAG: DUF3276 family protein [Aquificaceae bacterium]